MRVPGVIDGCSKPITHTALLALSWSTSVMLQQQDVSLKNDSKHIKWQSSHSRGCCHGQTTPGTCFAACATTVLLRFFATTHHAPLVLPL